MASRLLTRGRSDDTAAIIAKRMEGFNTTTLPALRLFKHKVEQQQQQQQQQQQTQTVATTATAGTNAVVASSASASAQPAPSYFTVDGNGTIQEVYSRLRPVFLQFLRQH